ncbi:hypothetical protein NPX13_g6253 [Xylaria arbuscula]|uniref:Uncharacterized protein n=1 Tax=Xylaria arbuscula TaxID=114810 RepID=A0A9W8TLX4_9PEZI|nr:hypothetical protein NPX13_g6253 [Xylaria arbuscula]
MASFPSDCLPPENEFESQDALFKAINTWASPRGYAFVVGRSTKEKTGRLTITYLCDRGGRAPDTSKERQRNTTTRRTGCLFSVLAKESLDKTFWALKHRPDQRFASYNHKPSLRPTAHLVLRELSTEEKSTIAKLSDAGIAPKEIRTYIRQSYNTIATQQDVYNRIADARREVCEGQSTVQALANQLDTEGFWNRPTIIRQNEGAKIWNEFYQSWHSIINSPNEVVFDERVQEFERRYLSDLGDEVTYVKNTWLATYKEKLVKAWVDRHLHFDNAVTSRVEGIHGLLKTHLKRSTLDLFEAWRAIKHALFNQLAELESNQAQQQVRTPIDLNGFLYSIVRGWVSHEALWKVDAQRKLLAKKDPPLSPDCSGSFTRSQGLPCAYTLQILLENSQPLRLEHFHAHWHLKRDRAPLMLLEPRQRIDPITANSKILRLSTQREPSSFEAVETAAAGLQALPTYSRCHVSGYTMASKVCPLRHVELLATADTTTAADRAASGIDIAAIATLAVIKAAANIAAVKAAAQAATDVTTEPAVKPVVRTTDEASDSINVILLSSSPFILSSSLRLLSLVLRYDSLRAIYQRYVDAREAWYKA